jgi:hypothetical protein
MAAVASKMAAAVSAAAKAGSAAAEAAAAAAEAAAAAAAPKPVVVLQAGTVDAALAKHRMALQEQQQADSHALHEHKLDHPSTLQELQFEVLRV